MRALVRQQSGVQPNLILPLALRRNVRSGMVMQRRTYLVSDLRMEVAWMARRTVRRLNADRIFGRFK